MGTWNWKTRESTRSKVNIHYKQKLFDERSVNREQSNRVWESGEFFDQPFKFEWVSERNWMVFSTYWKSLTIWRGVSGNLSLCFLSRYSHQFWGLSPNLASPP
jgi:hypothetical protein